MEDYKSEYTRLLQEDRNRRKIMSTFLGLPKYGNVRPDTTDELLWEEIYFALGQLKQRAEHKD